MPLLDVSKLEKVKQNQDYYCTFACIEISLKYLGEYNYDQEDIRNLFFSDFKSGTPMFLTYELLFSIKIPNFQARRYNEQKIPLLISYIKNSINTSYPVIQSLEIFHPIWRKAAHAIVIIGYDRKNMIYLDPGDGRCKLEKIINYEKFLSGHRDTLVIKKI